MSEHDERMLDEDSSSSSSSSSSGSQSLNPIKISDFKHLLETWLATNHDRVDGAYESGKGWEIWLHVELHLAVKAHDSKADIERELPGYGTPSMRADLALNSNVDTVPTCVIEIKTELKSEAGNVFWQRVGKDVDKGMDISSKLKKKNATPLAVAILLSKGAWDASASEVGAPKAIGKYIGCYYSIG